MALEQHPHAFRYEGRWWVSETPREQARDRLDAQRDWDRRNARAQRWWVSITIGAALGVALAFGLGVLVNLPAFVYLISLPIGIRGRRRGRGAHQQADPGHGCRARIDAEAPEHPAPHPHPPRRCAQGDG